MKRILLFCALVVSALTGCEGGNVTPDPELTLLTESEVIVSEYGGNVQIEFSTNNEWSAEVAVGSEWCSLDSYMGKSGEKVVINATTILNSGNEDRVASIVITSDVKSLPIKVTQSAHTEMSILSDIETKFLSVGGDSELQFSSNKDWTIEVVEGSDWLSFSETQGAASSEAMVTVTAGTNDGKRRTGEIKITAGEISESVFYIQHSTPPVVTGDFSDWDCYLPTPNDGKYDPNSLQVGDRYFTVNIADTENYTWGVANEFSKADFWIYSSSVIGEDGEQFKTTALRMGPGDADIKGNMVVFLIDKNDETPVFDEAVIYELTLFSSGRLADASKGEYVRIGGIELEDRNIGENVPTVEEAPFALNYSNEFPEVNSEWKGDWIPWEDAIEMEKSFADGWRLPVYDDIKLMKERLCYVKGRYYIASDLEDGKVACWLPQSGYQSQPQGNSIAGSYWSSQTSEGMSQFAWYLGFSEGGSALVNGMKYYGQSVRRIRTVEE